MVSSFMALVIFMTIIGVITLVVIGKYEGKKEKE
jgi:hypothetical protein